METKRYDRVNLFFLNYSHRKKHKKQRKCKVIFIPYKEICSNMQWIAASFSS